MTVYLDSSFAVALYAPGHPRHRKARAFFDNESGSLTLVCSAHAIAEMYVTLVRRLGTNPPMMSPAAARLLLTSVIAKTVDVRPISLADYRRALQLAPTIPVENALFYDLLHCVSADAARADELWTLNGKDFKRLQPVTEATIRVPPQ